MAEIFIVGVGRSGTSLLQSMFAAHSAVAMLPETSFLRRYVTDGSGAGRSAGGSGRRDSVAEAAAPDNRDATAEWAAQYDRDERLRRLDRELWSRAVEEAFGGAPPVVEPGVPRVVQVGGLYRALLAPEVAAAQAGKNRQTIAYTGDKDPRLIEFLPLLKELFPESHVIQIVRDPRDVLLSKSRAEWSKGRGWRANLAAGRFQLDLGDRFGRELWGWRYHTVRYEDLLEAPERSLRRLTAELDLEFEAGMLEFGPAAERLGRGETEAWKKETLGPLLKNNAGKWRNELSPRQTGLVEQVYRRWMERYGYEPSAAPTLGIPRLGARLFYGGASALYGGYRRMKVERLLRGIRG